MNYFKYTLNKWVIQLQNQQCKHANDADSQITDDENNKTVDENASQVKYRYPIQKGKNNRTTRQLGMKSKINIAINLQPHHDKLTHILIIKWVIQIQVMQCKHVSVAQTQVTNDENNKSVDDNSQVNCSNKQSQISTINHVHKQINSPYSILYLHKSHNTPLPPPHHHKKKQFAQALCQITLGTCSCSRRNCKQ